MKKTRIFWVNLFIFSALILSFIIVFVNAADMGYLGIIIMGEDPVVHIDSPLNVTYNFPLLSNYTLNLNVSSENNIQAWRYTLFDLRHNSINQSNVIFTPNTTFNAVRWGNKLTIYGNLSGGQVGYDEVYFNVDVPSSAPVIRGILNHSFICENSKTLIYVNVTNLDEDVLSYSLSPTNPLFAFESNNLDYFTKVYYIASLNLTKSYVGNHSYIFSVSDGFYSDSKRFNITVIEINRIPQIEDKGVKTLYLQGQDRSFDETWSVYDVEQGYNYNGNLKFNVSFSGPNLFNIDNYGRINFTANTSTLGVHNVSLCVTDNAISNIHPNISLCGNNGLNNTVCDDFSITVTNDNRAPIITNYYRLNLTFNTTGNQNIYFNITTFDPDFTVPDAYWYFDGVLEEYDSMESFNDFSHNYPCGLSGNHNVSVEITDGLLNASMSWNFSVSLVSCPATSSGGISSGGGDSQGFCRINLACELWSTCQNIEDSFLSSIISSLDYFDIKKNCSFIGLNEKSCGYQFRSCIDIKGCTKEVFPQKTFCQYISDPSCQDNLKNCHDSDCEVLVDCGGPCKPCSTCSDGLQNQGEKGIDCSGPCPNTCQYETPIVKEELKYTFYIIFLILLLLLLILVIINIIRVIRIKKEIGELNWYELLKTRKN